MGSMAMVTSFQLKIGGFRTLSSLLPPFRTQIPILHIHTLQTKSRTISRNVCPIKIRAMSTGSSDSDNLEDKVKKTFTENPVVVYSKSWCSYSSEVKSLFKRLGVEPFVVELDKLGAQGQQIQNTLASLTGQHTVPNVFIGGKHIGGCSDTVALHQSGELEPLLSEAGATRL